MELDPLHRIFSPAFKANQKQRVTSALSPMEAQWQQGTPLILFIIVKGDGSMWAGPG
jgi:hypothetical protein